MSKRKAMTDLGYRAYFAAFAIMLVIVAAAICILSGCLDDIIFKVEIPAAVSSDTADTQASPETEKETYASTDTEI